MKLLLDTHIFLWFIAGNPSLPTAWREAIRDPDHTIYLSSVSIWECIVKYHLGKLPLSDPPERFLPQQRETHSILSLPLDESCVLQLTTLPLIHRDPFDRMLICQALHHNLAIMTNDNFPQMYPVQLFS